MKRVFRYSIIVYAVIAVLTIAEEIDYFSQGAIIPDGSSEGGEIDLTPLFSAHGEALKTDLAYLCEDCLACLVLELLVFLIVVGIIAAIRKTLQKN